MAQRKRRGFKPPSARKMTEQELIDELERRKPAWTEFKRIPDEIAAKTGADEGWENSRYLVWIYKPDNAHSDRGDWNRLEAEDADEEGYSRFIQLSIKNHDKTILAHDWRDMMRIKNELISRDAEAFELYPRMDRVCDEANQFHLWVLLPEKEGDDWPIITAGWRIQLLASKEAAERVGAAQRDFEDGFLKEEDKVDIVPYLKKTEHARG